MPNYFIPHESHEELQNFKEEIAGLAKKNRTSRTNIGDLLIDWALQKVRTGELVFNYKPKMVIVIVDNPEPESERKPFIITPVEGRRKAAPIKMYGYRFTGTQHADIVNIAQQCNLRQGEVFIRLLRYALENHRASSHLC